MIKKIKIMKNTLNKISAITTGHPVKVTSIFLMVTFLMVIPLSQIETQSKMSDFMPENEFQDARKLMIKEFNSTNAVVSIIEANSGNILDREGLLLLSEMEENLTGSIIIEPYLIDHKDPVITISDAVKGVLHSMSNGTFGIANASDEMLDQAVTYTLSQEQYSSLVSDEDGIERKYTLIIVNVDFRVHEKAMEISDETLEIEIETILKERESSEYKAYIFGGYNKEIQDNTIEDLSILLPITGIVLILILFVALRSFLDVMISVIALIVTLIISFGLFSILNIPFNQLTFFAPIMIMVLSIDFAIHIFMRYNEENKKEMSPAGVMARAILLVGISISISAVTTMAGFASNGLSYIPAVASFGIFIAIGILVAFIVMMFFATAVKVLAENMRFWYRKKRNIEYSRTNDNGSSGKMIASLRKGSRNGLLKITRVPYLHPFTVLAIVLVLTAGSIGFAGQLERDMSWDEILAADSEKLYTQELLEENFPQTSPLWVSVIIKGDITRPSTLVAIDRSISNMADDDHVVVNNNTPSVVSMLTYMKVLMASGIQFADLEDKNSDGIPDSRSGDQAVLDYLYQNGIPGMVLSEDIRAVLSEDGGKGYYDMTLINLEVKNVDGIKGAYLLEELKDDFQSVENLHGIKIYYMGGPFENTNVLESMTEGMVVSTTVSIIICSVLVIFLFRSLRIGLVASVPVILVTLWLLGSIYLLGFNLNPVTATTTAMTIGIGIDYSIHFVERYRQERGKGRTIKRSLDMSIGNTGMALITAGATTAFGFAIISLSRIGMFHEFGILAALIVIYVLVATLFVLPAFIVLSEKAESFYLMKHTDVKKVLPRLRKDKEIFRL
jgi:predicted RND superfamily exporter protein